MRKAMIGWAAGVGLLIGVGCNPPKNATPDRTLGLSQATLNTFPGVVPPAKVAQRARPAAMRGTGGSGSAGTAAFGPTVPLRDTPVDASQVNYANQGAVVGGRGNAAEAYSTTAEQAANSVPGGALAPRRTGVAAPPAQLKPQKGKAAQQRGKKQSTQKKPRAKQQRAR